MNLRIVLVYPDLLGTYGDSGNAIVLAQRARWRGINAEIIEANSDAPLPPGDLYCLGGGEDGPQALAASRLASDGTLSTVVDDGRPVLCVCAGYQIAGHAFADSDGAKRDGLGLLDVVTTLGERRAVGELVAVPLDPTLPVITGFENHAGRTQLYDPAAALGRVRIGIGNGDGSEGSISERVIGTYAHGPFLARNPAFADLLLSWATTSTLEALDDAEVDRLRAERLSRPSRSSRSGGRS